MKSKVWGLLSAPKLSAVKLKTGFAMLAIAGTVAAGIAAPAEAAAIKPLTPAQLSAQGKERLLVAYKPNMKAAAQAAITKAGGRVVVDLSEDGAFAVEFKKGADAAVGRNAAVRFIEPDLIRYATGITVGKMVSSKTPTKTEAATMDSSQVTPYGITMVQADQVSDTNAASRKLCIIDSGIDLAHEDLYGVNVDGANFSGSGEWYTDEASHGTHVSGTIAALNNSLGVIGVMPSAKIQLYMAKVFDASGSTSTSVILQGLHACEKAKANVISMSLGGSGTIKLEETAYVNASLKGILIIAAAGNAGTSALSYPAGYPNVVSVAAIDNTMTVASFSQFNSDVELAGPGVSVLSTVPVGSQLGATLTVGESTYEVQPMAGSPLTSASGPLADFGIGDTPVAGSMNGEVCLIQRGTISFADKVTNCQNSGGIGAVIYNNTSGDLLGTLGTTVTTIPSIGATQADGATMETQLGSTATVSVAPSDAAYAYYSGTSMATPHVSAVAALVWSYYPNCKAAVVRNALDSSALDLGDPGRDVYYGYGLVQAKAALSFLGSWGC